MEPTPKKFTVMSAEQYAAIRHQVVEQHRHFAPRTPPLKPSDKLSRSIEALAASLSISILEGIIGRRPLSQLERWFSKDCFEKVKRRSAVTRDAIACQYANPALSYSPYSKKAKLPTVKRARAQKVAEGKYEVCVLVTDGQRTRAMALRIEKTFGNWNVTELEIG